MYKGDLLHPSGKGGWMLGKEFDRVVCEVQGEATCFGRYLN